MFRAPIYSSSAGNVCTTICICSASCKCWEHVQAINRNKLTANSVSSWSYCTNILRLVIRIVLIQWWFNNIWVLLLVNLMFCWPYIVIHQYSRTNKTYFLVLSLLRISSLYMFRALLAHLQEALHKVPLQSWWQPTDITRAIYQVPFV
jgi:hypothetical protein